MRKEKSVLCISNSDRHTFSYSDLQQAGEIRLIACEARAHRVKNSLMFLRRVSAVSPSVFGTCDRNKKEQRENVVENLHAKNTATGATHT